jgi:hypothetical protein
MIRSVSPYVLGFLLILPSIAQSEVLRFPDNHAVRRQLAQIIVAPTSEVLSTPSAVYRNPDAGNAVKFDVRTQRNDFYLLFTNEEAHRFPLDSPGSYIIKRREQDGSFVQVKIFLNGDPESFVRIFPMGDRTKMELFMYGYRLYKDVTIPVQFRRILTDPFSKVMALTASTIDWSLILPGRPLPEDRVVEGMVQVIRRELPLLTDHADGAMNARGRFVYIKNLQTLSHGGFNCSGFAKWIIDGLYQPRTGRLISIETLKKKHLELRGNRWSDPYEKARDPYFGLDWTRNLALSLTRIDNPQAQPRADDVTEVPFFRYIDNVGYPIDELKFILYELAVKEPGYFYLGAVNHEYGKDPVLREYTHVAVFFPYFDGRGSFRIAVMERNLETGVKSLQARYPNDFIHLVRVAASTDFNPPMP